MARGRGVARAPIFTTAHKQNLSSMKRKSSRESYEQSRGDVIIVTSRRRQETAQEVPLAISVIRGDSIESTGNFNVVKL